MIRALCCLCAFFLLTTTIAAEDDTKSLQGTWLIESATLAGRDHTEDFAGMKLVLDGDKYTVDFGKNTDKGTFRIDTTKKPRHIDIKSVEGPFKGKTLPGIYELKGDVLVLCLNADGDAKLRPAKFEAPEMTRNMMLTYKRQK